MAGAANMGGTLDGLYGFFGNPTTRDRQRLYQSQSGALTGSIDRAQAEARRQAMGAAASASQGGNPMLAGRLGAQAGADAAQRVQSQGLVQQQQLGTQQQSQELQARQQQGQWAQHMVGGLLNAGGQVLGMAVPAIGAAGGAAHALGGAGGGGMLGGLLGGGAAPMAPGSTLLSPQGGQGIPQQAQPPGTPPPGMRWDPQTNQWVPINGPGGSMLSAPSAGAPSPMGMLGSVLGGIGGH